MRYNASTIAATQLISKHVEACKQCLIFYFNVILHLAQQWFSTFTSCLIMALNLTFCLTAALKWNCLCSIRVFIDLSDFNEFQSSSLISVLNNCRSSQTNSMNMKSNN